MLSIHLCCFYSEILCLKKSLFSLANVYGENINGQSRIGNSSRLCNSTCTNVVKSHLIHWKLSHQRMGQQFSKLAANCLWWICQCQSCRMLNASRKSV